MLPEGLQSYLFISNSLHTLLYLPSYLNLFLPLCLCTYFYLTLYILSFCLYLSLPLLHYPFDLSHLLSTHSLSISNFTVYLYISSLSLTLTKKNKENKSPYFISFFDIILYYIILGACTFCYSSGHEERILIQYSHYLCEEICYNEYTTENTYW